MTTYDLNGVHVFNKFLWAKLNEKGIMRDSDYQGNLVPIIPTQQVPVFNDMLAGTPFIVYTYLVASYDVDIWANVEQVTYRIYSDDERKLRQISNFLIDLCKRYDWTASEVNDWIAGFDSLDGDEKKFEFKYVQVVGSTSPEPFATEGGRQNASVTVRLSFIHDSNPAVVGQSLGMRA
jgi:hypothetical protein